MSNMREALYQIEVMNFSKRPIYHSEDVVSKVLTVGDRRINTKLKVVDAEPQGRKRTLFKRAKDKEIAKRWAANFGSVISCDKVDISCYLSNIEHLNLEQPIQLIAEPEFVINKALELEQPKRKSQGIEIIGQGIDKP